MIWNPNFGYSEIWFLIVAVFAKWSWELCKEKLLRVLRFLRQHKTFYNVWNAASARSIISHPAELFTAGLERPRTVRLQKPESVLNCAHRAQSGRGGDQKEALFCPAFANCKMSPRLDTAHSSLNCDPTFDKSFWKPSNQPSFSLLLTTLDWIPELFKDKHLHGLELWHGDRAVGEDDEVEEGHGARVVQLGGKQQAGWGQQLQLGPGTRRCVKRLVCLEYIINTNWKLMLGKEKAT